MLILQRKTGTVSPGYTLTTGQYDSGLAVETGFSDGTWQPISYGTLAPGTYSGATIGMIREVVDNPGFPNIVNEVGIAILGSHLQTFFTTLTINGVDYASASASDYSTVSSPGYTVWVWYTPPNGANPTPGWVTATPYTVTIV